MKNLYRLFRRKGIYYVENAQTGRQQSLRTRDLSEAQALCAARNEAARMPSLNLAIGHAYLSASDPLMPTRTWTAAMRAVQETGRPSSRARKARAFGAACFDQIRAKPIVATIGADLLAVIEAGGRSANLFARTLHNYALKAGWLVRPVLAANDWPGLSSVGRRGITQDEHDALLAKERNPEWRQYLRLLWEAGCSQGDGAMLTRQSVDWEARTLSFRRRKLPENSEPTCLAIGARLESLLSELPQAGPLFPRLRLMTAENRAGHFQKLCARAGVRGVTLHCYRYAWAERAARAGYPVRWAKAALGHKSTAVHLAYAKKAGATCPSLEQFEGEIVRLLDDDQNDEDRMLPS
ncbi:MAG TPA: tyrosine-type recombinase/integrase [Verrucomicrobiae bacterium]|nr:tyrosine-type recombinase/integrase [Verrucomicrobiae bacterium]